VIAYRAMLDVPRELVRHLAGLLAAERRALGTRKKTRALTCWYHALLVLVWYRNGDDAPTVAPTTSSPPSPAATPERNDPAVEAVVNLTL
jgi:hypothetical protein